MNTRKGSEIFSRPVKPAELKAFCVAAMRRCGLREEDAEVTAEVLVTADTMGVFTHGTRQVRPLMKNVRMGRLDPQARATVVAEGTSWALVDGHYAMPMATSTMAMRLAMDKAAQAGVAYVGVRRSSHFGAAGYYAMLALERDMIGISMCNVDPCMTVPGGRGPILGTNPIAYAVPAGQEKPIFLDIATSAVAATKVLAAKAEGRTIPDTWVVDADGLPTTDPRVFPELGGALLPMAGYKGYGLALFIEVLCGALTGAAMISQIKSWIEDSPEPTNEGHAFLTIDVGQMMPMAEFKERVDWMIREIKAKPKAKGAERIWLPGEMEWERREVALREGIRLPDHVVANLIGLSEDVNLDPAPFFEGSSRRD